jgi:aromatic-L-amino-acid decarboxylase
MQLCAHPDEKLHRAAFTDRPDYLTAKARGLAGGNPWPVEYGPELSRGFRALKVWAQIAEFGTDRLGRMIERNCYQASYLGEQVEKTPGLELLAPVALNICCFRYTEPGLSDAVLDAMNDEIVIQLQEQGERGAIDHAPERASRHPREHHQPPYRPRRSRHPAG